MSITSPVSLLIRQYFLSSGVRKLKVRSFKTMLLKASRMDCSGPSPSTPLTCTSQQSKLLLGFVSIIINQIKLSMKKKSQLDDELDRKYDLLQQKIQTAKVPQGLQQKNQKLVFTANTQKQLKRIAKKEDRRQYREDRERSEEEEEEEEPKVQLTEEERKEKEERRKRWEQQEKEKKQKEIEKKKQEKEKKKLAKVKQSQDEEQSGWDRRKITFMMICATLFVSYYIAKQHEKAIMRNFIFTKDYYDILELESTVPQEEIKKQFKKLALLWHPDKNKNCGVSCQLRFQEINNAYEVLGNPSKREIYDQTLGQATQIQSKSITLTPYYYQHHVINSHHFWIIQVFSDTSPNSQHFASSWERLLDQFGSSVSMGRINLKDKDQFEWLDSFRLSDDNMPFIFGYQQSIGFHMMRINPNQPDKSFLKFIQDLIPQKVIEVDNIQKQEVIRKLKKPIVVVSMKQNNTPIFLQQLALQLQDDAELYVTKGNQNNEIGFYWSFGGEKYQQVKRINQFKHAYLEQYIELFKSLVQYDVYKESYLKYCNRQEKQICVFIFDKKLWEEEQNYIKRFQSERLAELLNKEDDMNVLSFGYLNVNEHENMDALITNYRIKHEEKVVGIAIMPNIMKFEFLTESEGFRRWIDDLLEEDGQEMEYILQFQQIEQTGELISVRRKSIMDVQFVLKYGLQVCGNDLAGTGARLGVDANNLASRGGGLDESEVQGPQVRFVGGAAFGVPLPNYLIIIRGIQIVYNIIYSQFIMHAKSPYQTTHYSKILQMMIQQKNNLNKNTVSGQNKSVFSSTFIIVLKPKLNISQPTLNEVSSTTPDRKTKTINNNQSKKSKNANSDLIRMFTRQVSKDNSQQNLIPNQNYHETFGRLNHSENYHNAKLNKLNFSTTNKKILTNQSRNSSLDKQQDQPEQKKLLNEILKGNSSQQSQSYLINTAKNKLNSKNRTTENLNYYFQQINPIKTKMNQWASSPKTIFDKYYLLKQNSQSLLLPKYNSQPPDKVRTHNNKSYTQEEFEKHFINQTNQLLNKIHQNNQEFQMKQTKKSVQFHNEYQVLQECFQKETKNKCINSDPKHLIELLKKMDECEKYCTNEQSDIKIFNRITEAITQLIENFKQQLQEKSNQIEQIVNMKIITSQQQLLENQQKEVQQLEKKLEKANQSLSYQQQQIDLLQDVVKTQNQKITKMKNQDEIINSLIVIMEKQGIQMDLIYQEIGQKTLTKGNQSQSEDSKDTQKGEIDKSSNIKISEVIELGKEQDGKSQSSRSISFEINPFYAQVKQMNPGGMSLNLNNMQKNQQLQKGYHEEFMNKFNEFSESWREQIQKEKRF